MALTVTWTDVTHRYGSNAEPALNALNLRLDPGQTLALLGPNGAGKSTAIKLLLGLLKVQTGTVTIDGRAPNDPATRERLGGVLQVSGLPAKLSVREQIALHAAYYRAPRAVDEVLDALGLTALRSRRLNTLSGGERRRLEVALALIGNPKLLVLDEPTVGVDLNERTRVLELLAALKAGGTTMLITTHLTEEAERLADRVALIDRGELKFAGSLSELKASSGRVELKFRSRLDRDTLAALDPDARLLIEPSGQRIETADGNRYLRALLDRDPSAQIESFRQTTLDAALRQLLTGDR
jgi:ABC-2 type transport system ATP-binding protein